MAGYSMYKFSSAAVALSVLVSVGCAPVGFEASKEHLMSKSSVFGRSTTAVPVVQNGHSVGTIKIPVDSQGSVIGASDTLGDVAEPSDGTLRIPLSQNDRDRGSVRIPIDQNARPDQSVLIPVDQSGSPLPTVAIPVDQDGRPSGPIHLPLVQPSDTNRAVRVPIDIVRSEVNARLTVDQAQFPNGHNSIPIEVVCADRYEGQVEYLKRAANSKTLAADLRVNGTVCLSDEAQIMRLVTSGGPLTIAQLRSHCPDAVLNGVNYIHLHINGVPQWKNAAGKMVTTSDGRYIPRMLDDKKFEVIYAKNRHGKVDYDNADNACTRRASPLVVHMASDVRNPKPIALSSHKQGIDFDLLGLRNFFRKVRISWFTNRDYRMLSLPDASGRVNGIDQLFGDNTLGPDGDFAENGYAALAKYDGTSMDGRTRLAPADGKIDHRDAIYPRLRLWLDINRNGMSDAGELSSLHEHGIAFIDLKFSDQYREVDRYGNETKMKSVVGYDDGSLDLIFDLWFSYSRGVHQ